mgnify:CR=1 FL=1
MLRSARAHRDAEAAAAVGVLEDALEWALMHEPVSPGDGSGACWWEAGQAYALAGAGTPEVAEFAVAELAAALGLSTEAGRGLVADALDLAFRLESGRSLPVLRPPQGEPARAPLFFVTQAGILAAHPSARGAHVRIPTRDPRPLR